MNPNTTAATVIPSCAPESWNDKSRSSRKTP